MEFQNPELNQNQDFDNLESEWLNPKPKQRHPLADPNGSIPVMQKRVKARR